MAKKTFDDISLAELGRITRSRYDGLCAAHDAGMDDRDHPADRWAQDTEVLKAYRASQDAAKDEENTGGSPRNIQRTPTGKQIKSGADTGDPDMSEDAEDPDMSEDDDQPKISGGLPNKRPAMDGQFSHDSAGVPQFITRAGDVITGDAALAARAKSSTSQTRHAMSRAIRGYSRLK